MRILNKSPFYCHHLLLSAMCTKLDFETFSTIITLKKNPDKTKKLQVFGKIDDTHIGIWQLVINTYIFTIRTHNVILEKEVEFVYTKQIIYLLSLVQIVFKILCEKEKIADTIGLIRIRKLKDIPYNIQKEYICQKKNNALQNTRQTNKYCSTRTPQKPVLNSVAPE